MEKSLYITNKELTVVKLLTFLFCVLEIPGSILAHNQANLLVHEISAGITWLNSMTFYSLHISILPYYTKLLNFSITNSKSLALRGLILLFKINIPFMFVQTNSTWYLQVLYLGTSYRNNNKLDIIALSYAGIHTLQ